jgi:hypothetical protein
MAFSGAGFCHRLATSIDRLFEDSRRMIWPRTGLLGEKKGVVEKIAKRLLEVETLGEEEFRTFLSAPVVPR